MPQDRCSDRMTPREKERYSRQILFPGIQGAGTGAPAAVACGHRRLRRPGDVSRGGAGPRRSRVGSPLSIAITWNRATCSGSGCSKRSMPPRAMPKAAAAVRRLAAINADVRVDGVVADLTAANIAAAAGRRRSDSGRHGQFRDALPDQRLCDQPKFTVDLWRGGWQLRPDHAGDSGTHLLPALRLSESAGGCAAHLRDRGCTELGHGGDRGDSGGGCPTDPVRPRRQCAPADHDPGCVGRNCTSGHTTRSRSGLSGLWSPRFRISKRRNRRAPVSLCGRNAVQVSEARRLDLRELRERLLPLGDVQANDFALRFFPAPYEITFFPDGRAIVKGTSDIAVARSLYAKYVG